MTAISSNRADKKAEKLLEREIARKKRKLQKTTAFDVFNIIFLLILAFIVIVPFYYTIVRSFLTQQEFIMNGTTLWPQSPTTGNYRDIFVGTGLLRSFFNSVLYTVTGTLFSMFLATTLAYGLSKKNYPGRALFQNMIVFTMYFGGGVVPFFLLVKDLGLYGNRFAVVIALAFNAFNMIILRNFFESLPPDLEEAAMLDGASPFRIFWQIDLPLMKPALATVTLYFIVDRNAAGTAADSVDEQCAGGGCSGGAGAPHIRRRHEGGGGDCDDAAHHVRVSFPAKVFCKGRYDWGD